MSDYVDQLRGAVQAVEVLSPTTFSWFGARSPEIPENVRSALTPRTARSFLLYNLQWQLYHNFYCRGGAQPVAHEVSGSLLVGVTPFIEELQSANAGQGYWEAGWTALAEYGDAVAAGKNGLTLLAQPGDYASLSNGTSPPGIELGLRFPKDLLGISPGFYMALGNSSSGQQDVVRFYWNVSAEGAVRLMRLVTHEFNAVGLPYNLKVVNDPAHYNRCDAAVLYARMADYPSIYRILWDMYPKIEETLSSRVPALTRQLAPGLGLAEDPGYGESF